MKKILLLLLGGVLLVTTVTGCSNTLKKESKEEIEGLFSDFMSVFQSDNYEFLYDKKGGNSNLPEGDLGSWILTANMYHRDVDQDHMIGIQLIFNKNLRMCRGDFTIDDNKYPIFYENGKIGLIDQNTSLDVKDELSNFKLLFDIINLDEAYLHTLESKRYFYNYEVPLYGTSYYLPDDDKNREALKYAYTNFPHNAKEVVLEFEGTGNEPWNTTSTTDLNVMFDTEGYNFFSASLSFNKTEMFESLFELDL